MGIVYDKTGKPLKVNFDEYARRSNVKQLVETQPEKDERVVNKTIIKIVKMKPKRERVVKYRRVGDGRKFLGW